MCTIVPYINQWLEYVTWIRFPTDHAISLEAFLYDINTSENGYLICCNDTETFVQGQQLTAVIQSNICQVLSMLYHIVQYCELGIVNYHNFAILQLTLSHQIVLSCLGIQM